MKTEDTVLISFLEDLLNQGKCYSSTLPNGKMVSGNMSEIADWLEKVLDYYKTNKIQIEKDYLLKNKIN